MRHSGVKADDQSVEGFSRVAQQNWDVTPRRHVVDVWVGARVAQPAATAMTAKLLPACHATLYNVWQRSRTARLTVMSNPHNIVTGTPNILRFRRYARHLFTCLKKFIIVKLILTVYYIWKLINRKMKRFVHHHFS